MKALVKEKPEPGLSLLDIEKPEIKQPDEVRFKVEYCAICVGETKVYDWNEWAAADTTLHLPTVLGHEVAAVVSEVGSQVKQFKPGDRITVDPLIHCGHCYLCRKGYTNMCLQREIYGKRRGAFAEYAVLPEQVICKLPDKLSLTEGAILENLGIAVHAVEVEPHDPGDTAVVIGCGPIGIMAAQTLVASGVNVVMTDVNQSRLDMAAEISGADVINVSKENPVEHVKAMTAGRGADFVLEAAATPSALEQAFELVRQVGTIVTIGTFNSPVSFNPFFKMTRREIKLVSTMGRTWETWRRMVQLIDSDKLNLKPFISQILPLEEYQKGFELVKAGEVMKVLLKP
ncbi:MAG: alcohol dehydrogenase catalytic domain-containing protein [Anaerolineae bacterium]|nr:alcohol dehydrogenase catalytic domain-containing protein [Anaerolineae bacterium]